MKSCAHYLTLMMISNPVVFILHKLNGAIKTINNCQLDFMISVTIVVIDC